MRNAPRRRPSLEALEDRSLLSNYGMAWPDPGHLTVSFVPDGTSISGTPSNLFSTMNSEMPNQWQPDVLSALQSWAASSNINIGVVADDGRPIGAPGPAQGVPGVGDIRIAARPLSNDEVAIGSPYDALGGWEGTIIINSNASFGDGPSALENFLSAVTHEAGHVFGFPDQNTDPTSIMYDVDNGVRIAPSAGDLKALQCLYGARANGSTNSSFGTASPLTLNASQAVDASIDTLSEQEDFSFNAPWTGAGGIAVDVRTQGVSLLTPKVTVYDAFGDVLATGSSTDPLNNNVVVTLPFTVPWFNYYVKVQSSQSNNFGIGSYRIAVGSPSQAQTATLAAEPLTYAANNGDNAFATATVLTPSTPGTDARWTYAITNGLTSPSDTDFVQLQTGAAAPASALITVANVGSSPITPVVSVFDAHHNLLSAQLLNGSAGGETVQVMGIAANSTLYVEVSAGSSTSATATNNYFLGVSFPSRAIVDPNFSSGTLTASNPLDFRTLTIDSTRLFHFDLSGSDAAGSPASAVLVTIFDASQNAVFNLRSVAGASASSGDVMLKPGTYIVRVIAASQTGVALPSFKYVLNGQLRDDPDGTNPIDTTLDPVGANPTGPPTDPGTWSQNNSSYYQYNLQHTDIYGNPWS